MRGPLLRAIHADMRLWTLHPKYLDPKGLVALWREALLLQESSGARRLSSSVRRLRPSEERRIASCQAR
ncbi:MAG TPA: pyrimidine dimer DNA glycosylase/endonuclease V [Rhodocyclaceae bacterium]|nr:pyrimidine dimer DNA glycosylase/endonuclease V [Rhodocyclaceae bacterium]